jgi:hypothetical protein
LLAVLFLNTQFWKTGWFTLITDKKKKVLAYLYKNPGITSPDFKVGIPAQTVEKLLNQLEEEQMAIKDQTGWRVPTGKDVVNMKRLGSDQITEEHIREMMRFCVQK